MMKLIAILKKAHFRIQKLKVELLPRTLHVLPQRNWPSLGNGKAPMTQPHPETQESPILFPSSPSPTFIQTISKSEWLYFQNAPSSGHFPSPYSHWFQPHPVSWLITTASEMPSAILAPLNSSPCAFSSSPVSGDGSRHLTPRAGGRPA